MDAPTRIALGSCIAAWLTLVVYVVLGFYAKRQLDEYRQERREALRPYVVVDFDLDFILDITVANVGARPARDVRFSFSEPLTSTLQDSGAVNSVALRHGLPMLPPGKRYAFQWDSATARFSAGTLCMTYRVTVDYVDDHDVSYQDTYILDLASLSDASIERAPWHGVVKAIDELRRETHKWTDGSRGLLVHSRDKHAMARAQTVAYEARREAHAAAEVRDPEADEP